MILDDKDASLLARTLKKRGYSEVNFYSDPSIAIEKIESGREKPEIALLDYSLNHPEYSGIDVAEKLRKYTHSKIVCISGHSSLGEGVTNAWRGLGKLPSCFDAIHIKPIDLNRLEEVLLILSKELTHEAEARER